MVGIDDLILNYVVFIVVSKICNQLSMYVVYVTMDCLCLPPGDLCVKSLKFPRDYVYTQMDDFTIEQAGLSDIPDIRSMTDSLADIRENISRLRHEISGTIPPGRLSLA